MYQGCVTMTRHIYRDPVVEKELEAVMMNLKQIRKHQYDHFTLHALIEMQLACDCLERAIMETQLSPKHSEEFEAGL